MTATDDHKPLIALIAAVAENGAWPLPLPDTYKADIEHLALYAKMAASEEGFAEYVGKYVKAEQAQPASW